MLCLTDIERFAITGEPNQAELNIPVGEGRMLLGNWQGVYLFEHRRPPRQRELILHLIGD